MNRIALALLLATLTQAPLYAEDKPKPCEHPLVAVGQTIEDTAPVPKDGQEYVKVYRFIAESDTKALLTLEYKEPQELEIFIYGECEDGEPEGRMAEPTYADLPSPDVREEIVFTFEAKKTYYLAIENEKDLKTPFTLKLVKAEKTQKGE